MLVTSFSLFGAFELLIGGFIFGLGFGIAEWLIKRVLK